MGRDDELGALDAFSDLGGTIRRLYRRGGKRMLDIVLGVALAVIMAPVVGLTALVVWIRLGRPVLFRQTRAGLNGKPFTLYKFRTMAEAYEADGRVRPDAKRLTKLGRLLRSTSLDELPELFNVLRGDMSLVGPRPLYLDYLELYSAEQARRHEVKPGITGLAQVSGRNEMSWEQKFEHDVRYVEHCSPLLDLKILVRTVGAVLRREGISQPGQASARRFEGSGQA